MWCRIFWMLVLIVILWLGGNIVVSAQQQLARQADLDRIEEELRDMRAQHKEMRDLYNSHVISDYKTFSAMVSGDAGKINDLATRLAVLEVGMTTITRILWGIVAAVSLQLLHLVVAGIRLDIRRKRDRAAEAEES